MYALQIQLLLYIFCISLQTLSRICNEVRIPPFLRLRWPYFFLSFAANCVFSRVCKFFGVVFRDCIGLNSYLGRKRLTRSSVSRSLRFALHNTVCIIFLSYVNILKKIKKQTLTWMFNFLPHRNFYRILL